MATLCSPDADGNLFAAVNLQDDENVIQIDKLSNPSELYFFKLLMKADTNVGFGEEIVVMEKDQEVQLRARGIETGNGGVLGTASAQVTNTTKIKKRLWQRKRQ